MLNPKDYEKDFEDRGKVSIWLCKFHSSEALNAYMKEYSTDDGDIYSEFSIEFRMGYLNHDFIEYIFHENQSIHLEQLFTTISYSTSIVENIKKSRKAIDTNLYNTVICVFDYHFILDADYVQKNDHVEYWGAVEYNSTANSIEA